MMRSVCIRQFNSRREPLIQTRVSRIVREKLALACGIQFLNRLNISDIPHVRVVNSSDIVVNSVMNSVVIQCQYPF